MQIAMLLLLLSAQPLKPFGGVRFPGNDRMWSGYRTPPNAKPTFSLLMSSTTADECTGSALVSSEGTAVTFSRASSKWCRKSDGSMTLLTSNQPVVEGGRNTTGLSIEPAATNEQLYGDDLSQWTVGGGGSLSTDTQSGPWGGTTMDSITTTSAQDRYQCPSGASTTGPFTLSAWGRSTTGSAASAGLIVQCNGSTLATCVCGRDDGLSCAILSSGNSCGGSTSFFASTGRAVRFWLTATCNAAITAPCAGVAGGIPFSTGGTLAWGKAQLERGVARPTSPIDTTSTAVTRAADVASFFAPTEFNTAGCFSARTGWGGGTFPSGTGRWLNFSGGSPLSTSSATTLTSYDGTNTGTKTIATQLNTTSYARSVWDVTNGQIVRMNEVDATPATYDGSMGALKGSTVYIGSEGGTTNFLNGNITKIKLGSSTTACTVPDYFVSYLAEISAPTEAAYECVAGQLLYSDQGRLITFTRGGAGIKWCTRTIDGKLVAMAVNDPAINANGIEATRAITNQAFRSHEIDLWGTLTNVTVTANNTNGPDNAATADRINVSSGSAVHIAVDNSFTFLITTDYTVSIYAKAGTVNFLGLSNTTAGVNYAVFDLSNGTVSSTGGSGTTTTSRISGPFLNGFYRLEISFTVSGSTGGSVNLTPGDTAAHAIPGTTWNAAGTENVYAWGAQIESPSRAATPLITTAGSTAATASDIISFTPTGDLSAEGCSTATVLSHRPWTTADRVIGTATNAAPMSQTASATFTDLLVGDATQTVTVSGLTSMIDRATTARSWWRASNHTMGIAADGLSNSGTFDDTMGTANGTIWFGGQNNSVAGGEWIKNVRLGTKYDNCVLP